MVRCCIVEIHRVPRCLEGNTEVQHMPGQPLRFSSQESTVKSNELRKVFLQAMHCLQTNFSKFMSFAMFVIVSVRYNLMAVFRLVPQEINTKDVIRRPCRAW